jgi:hypothetical protein
MPKNPIISNQNGAGMNLPTVWAINQRTATTINVKKLASATPTKSVSINVFSSS